MIFNKKTLSCALLLLLYCTASLAANYTQDRILKVIHDRLVDSFLPNDETIKEYRDKWKEESFRYIISEPKLISMLKFLKELNFLGANDTDVFLFKLQNSQDTNIAKNAANIRRFYLYMLYNASFINKMAKVNVVEPNPYTSCKAAFPKSKLSLTGNEIIHQDGEFDYLIIGSGPAGSLIAHELVRNIKGRVLIVDSGPLIEPNTVLTEFQSVLMESNNNRYSDDGSIIIRNGQTVGGGSTVNVDLAFSPLLPAVQNKIQSWINLKQAPYETLHKDDHDFSNIATAYQWVTEKLNTRNVQTFEVNKNNMLLMTGVATGRTYDLNTKPTKIIDNLSVPKISAVEAFLWPALFDRTYKGDLSILPDVKAMEIIHDGSIASQVNFVAQTPIDYPCVISDPNYLQLTPNQKFSIKAKNIILASGALGSSELLLRSNIPNKNIGTGLVVHPSFAIGAFFKEKVNITNGISATVYAHSIQPEDEYYLESMSALPSFMASVNPGSGKEILDQIKQYETMGGFGVMLVDTVNPSNRVYIDPESNLVEVSYTLSPSDKKRFRKAIIEGVKILFKQGAQYNFIPSLENIYSSSKRTFSSAIEAEEAINKMNFTKNLTTVTSAHMQSTNKMGSDPSNSVVSLRLKLWNQTTGEEFKNLSVVDSSVFPTSIGANPMQSVYTIAKLFIDKHLQQYYNIISK